MYKHHKHTHTQHTQSTREMETKEQEEDMIMRNPAVQERFSEFYEKWLIQQETYLKQLLVAQRDHHHHHHPTPLSDVDSSSSDDQIYRALISNLMNHFKEYYSTKWVGAHEDILGFFCPPWVTPLEKAYHWVTEWKPSMLYRLIRSLNQPRELPNSVIGGSLINLTDHQLNRIKELKLKTGLEEASVDREMERQQMSMADRKMVELARLSSHHRIKNDGGSVVEAHQVDKMVEVALNGLLGELEKLLKTADCVRLKAMKGVLEVLTPLQSVDFMAAFLVLQFQLRRLGKERLQYVTAN